MRRKLPIWGALAAGGLAAAVMLRRSRRSPVPVGQLPRLPDSFLFGVATSAHQFEAFDAKHEDIRDVWERQHSLQVRGRATEFDRRYPEDIALARDLGCKVFRFSMSWTRLEPAPGQWNEAEFDHYRELIRMIRQAGMEPLLTLCHFAWPLHVEERGGLIGQDFPDIFENFVEAVASRLGQDIRYYITFNEPTLLVFGYLKAWWQSTYSGPPGLPPDKTFEDQMAAVARLIPNLFAAHTRARAVVKRYNPGAMVGSNPWIFGLPAWLQKLIDRNATQIHGLRDLLKQAPRIGARSGWLRELGQADVVVAALSRTPDREAQVSFSDVYYIAQLAVLVPAKSPVQRAQELSGRNVVVIKGSTSERDLGTLIPGARPYPVTDYDDALAALDRGRAEAFLSDDTILRSQFDRHPERYRLLPNLLRGERYAAAVAAGNLGLLNEVNEAIRQFKDSGAWAESYARYIGTPVPKPPPTPKSLCGMTQLPEGSAPNGPEADLEQIRRRGYLVVAVKNNVPCLGACHPETGEYSGLEIDLAHEVARRILGDPTRVRFQPVVTQQRLSRLQSALHILDPILKTYSLLTTAVNANWWYLGMAGRLPEFLCPRECVGQLDFVGLDYYFGVEGLRPNRLRRIADAFAGHYSGAPVWPGGLCELLRYHAELFPDKPIWIIENGCVDEEDGMTRPQFLREHIAQVQKAVGEGINVMGYICWSITSNREWGLMFGPNSDFGLYHVDLDTDPELLRIPTPSAELYREIIAHRGV